ncbi:DDE-type integrase/transposase/recombinase [Streptomyces sp. NPDC046374]|uniref:DDE-type integrase/transposase/recombinase n=1 Tax=unclassified Streptomyces TaxID=2593676 RepID=UPI00340EE00E
MKVTPAPDLIGRDFHAERPGTKLVGDITYLPTTEGWHYLACWLDLATREVVGYAVADHHRAELVLDALDMAYCQGELEPGCVIHSDRGGEYTSTQFPERIRKFGLRQCCGRTGSCFDNAAAESFWALVKEDSVAGSDSGGRPLGVGGASSTSSARGVVRGVRSGARAGRDRLPGVAEPPPL